MGQFALTDMHTSQFGTAMKDRKDLTRVEQVIRIRHISAVAAVSGLLTEHLAHQITFLTTTPPSVSTPQFNT